MRQPLGVVAGITPVQLSSDDPVLDVCGRDCLRQYICPETFRERPVSSACAWLSFLRKQVHLTGVLNMVNGDKTAVDAILEPPRHQGRELSSVHPTSRNMSMRLARRTANAYRQWAAQKTMASFLPDANMEQAVKDIVGAAYGSAGERCMALPVAVTVGQKTSDEFVERMLDAARGLEGRRLNGCRCALWTGRFGCT